jgi:hypothetical protein
MKNTIFRGVTQCSLVEIYLVATRYSGFDMSDEIPFGFNVA